MTAEHIDESDTPLQSKFNSLIDKIKNLIFRKKSGSFNKVAYENLNIPGRDMIKGIFALADQTARDIMIPRVDIKALDTEMNLEEIIKTVCKFGHSRLPVFEGTIDNIKGILYAKDMLKFVIDKPRKFNIKKILHKPIFVPETMPLDELLTEFKKLKQHLSVVLDEYGGIAGIVTLEDILEEIVGEIKDEFDSDELQEFIEMEPGHYDVDSRMTIKDLNETIGTDFSDEDYDTVGGLVFELFGKIPVKDDTVKNKDITFQVTKIRGTVIERILIITS